MAVDPRRSFPSSDRSCPLSPLSATNSARFISLVYLVSFSLPSSIVVKEGKWLGSA